MIVLKQTQLLMCGFLVRDFEIENKVKGIMKGRHISELPCL